MLRKTTPTKTKYKDLFPSPSTVWQDVTMDFVGGFPKVGGKTVILTVVDRLSKYNHFIVAFFENIVRLHGVPASIVSDRDPIFMCGGSFSDSTGRPCASVMPFDRKLTSNRRSQIGLSQFTSAAWPAIDPRAGCGGFHG
jgi:hypothetical protein